MNNYPEQYNFNRAEQIQKRVRLSKTVIEHSHRNKSNLLYGLADLSGSRLDRTHKRRGALKHAGRISHPTTRLARRTRRRRNSPVNWLTKAIVVASAWNAGGLGALEEAQVFLECHRFGLGHVFQVVHHLIDVRSVAGVSLQQLMQQIVEFGELFVRCGYLVFAVDYS